MTELPVVGSDLFTDVCHTEGSFQRSARRPPRSPAQVVGGSSRIIYERWVTHSPQLSREAWMPATRFVCVFMIFILGREDMCGFICFVGFYDNIWLLLFCSSFQTKASQWDSSHFYGEHLNVFLAALARAITKITITNTGFYCLILLLCKIHTNQGIF